MMFDNITTTLCSFHLLAKAVFYFSLRVATLPILNLFIIRTQGHARWLLWEAPYQVNLIKRSDYVY